MSTSKNEAFDLIDHDKVIAHKKDVIGGIISERKQNLVTDVNKRQNDKEVNSVAEEKTSFFRKFFQEEYSTIDNMLNCDGIAVTDRLALTEHFDAVTVSFQRLQKFFNDSSMFLTAYDMGKAQKMLSTIQEQIAKRRSELLPKKKFAFKSKVKKSENKNHDTTDKTSNASALQKYQDKMVKYQGCEIASKHDETITLENDALQQKDVTLSNLTNCRVHLLGTPSTVHINNVDKCVIAVGPVSGSVFVNKCTDSEIAAACQQLRVHHTRTTDFYIHVTSRAIIEETTEVRFAPYTFTYPNLQEHSKLARIELSTQNCDKIDDFNWLAMDTPSPNWSPLEIDNQKRDW